MVTLKKINSKITQISTWVSLVSCKQQPVVDAGRGYVMLAERRMTVVAADKLHWQKILDCLQMLLLLLPILYHHVTSTPYINDLWPKNSPTVSTHYRNKL